MTPRPSASLVAKFIGSTTESGKVISSSLLSNQPVPVVERAVRGNEGLALEATRSLGQACAVGAMPCFHQHGAAAADSSDRTVVGCDTHSLSVPSVSNRKYVVDGVARLRPNATGGDSFVLRTEAPGVITMEVFGEEYFRFERGEFVPPPPSIFTDTDGALVRMAARLEAPLPVRFLIFGESPSDLIRALTESMHSTRHGGLLLFLPTEPTAADLNRVKLRVLHEDILQQAYITVNELAFQAMSDKDGSFVGEELHEARETLVQWARAIGRLTALDNAVLIGPGFRVFGAQYEVPSDTAPIIYEAANVQGDAGAKYTKRHGSRHRAAACFVNEGEGRIAILSSADGPLRCFMKVNDHVVMWPIRLSAL